MAELEDSQAPPHQLVLYEQQGLLGKDSKPQSCLHVAWGASEVQLSWVVVHWCGLSGCLWVSPCSVSDSSIALSPWSYIWVESFFFCVYVHRHVGAYLCGYMCAQVCTHGEMRGQLYASFVQSHPPLPLRQRSLIGLKSSGWARLAGQPAPGICLSLSLKSWVYKHATLRLVFLTRVRGWTSDPHACLASALLPGPSPESFRCCDITLLSCVNRHFLTFLQER